MAKAIAAEAFVVLIHFIVALTGATNVKVLDDGYTSASYGVAEDTADGVSVSKTTSGGIMFRRNDGTTLFLKLSNEPNEP